MDYLKDGRAIYEQSFQTIREEADLSAFPDDVATIVVRMIHACGMTDITGNIAFDPGFVTAARTALRDFAPILCDTNMVAGGVTRARLPAGNEVICHLSDPSVPDLAASLRTTRSAAALELWRGVIDGAVVAIGNAPTALFRLLEAIDQGWPKPAVIIGLPVGFVGAAESKAALAANPRGIPFITLQGRRGGSPMTVAAINALAQKEEL